MVVERCGDTSHSCFNLEGFSSCSTARQQRSWIQHCHRCRGTSGISFLKYSNYQGSNFSRRITGHTRWTGQKRSLEIYVEDMKGQEMENSSQLYVDLVDELRIARLLRPEDSYSIHVKLELPTSQGFGMSAAGLLAVARCFSSITGKGTEEQYQRIAHRIERKHGSGLGDVLGMSKRGVELRLGLWSTGFWRKKLRTLQRTTHPCRLATR